MRLTLRLVLAAVFFSACSGDDSIPASPGPGSPEKLFVELSANVDTIPESTSKTYTARVTDQTGFLKSVPITWSSTDANIATVANGYVTGITPGIAYVIAATSGAADTAQVVVTENELTLDVQPSAAEVAMGDTIEFVATLRSRSGDILAVNAFSWNSSDTTAAEFVGGGSLKTKAEGELLVTAEAMRRSGEGRVRIFRSPVSSVSISPSTANVYKGAKVKLVATPRDQYGRSVQSPITWGSSDNTRATVNTVGEVTGIGAGTVVITATAESKTASATMSVLSAPAAAVEISLPSPTLLVGVEMQATATMRDASGDPVIGKTIAWQSANPSIATVTSTGKVRGIKVGEVNVRAIVDGIVASEEVSVQGRQAASIAIVPAFATVGIGQQAPLVAKVLDQNGLEIAGQSFSWSSANSGVASVSSSGVMQGVSAGVTSIVATSGLLSSSATATVVGASVASVRVSPATSSLTVGGKVTLIAEALDANQNVLPGRPVSWNSQSSAIATVNGSGVVTAVSAGAATINAVIEGKSVGAVVTVNPAVQAPVAEITVSLSKATLNIGDQAQATATLNDAAGNNLTGPVTWSSLDNAVATVSSSGLVTASGAGTVAIMARSGNVSGAASLNVNAATLAPVAKVTMATPKANLNVGESVQTVITLYDAAGTVLTGRTITYTTDNGTIISVSASGVVKGLKAGNTIMRAKSGSVATAEGFVVSATTATVSSIAVSPSTTSLSVGQTKQVVATARDGQGATINGGTFTWTTSNAAVATVSTSGLVTAAGTGTATIHAASAGVTGSMSVTVTPAAPASAVVATVSVSLSPSSINVGGTAQATAVARDANGVVISGKTAAWSLGVALLANVSSSGVVSGLLAGLVPVNATIDGITGSSSLTIQAAVAPPPLPPPPTSTVVELPRTYLNFSFPTKTGQTIVVPAGGNLQTALNNAQRGDEIVLTAGATYSGNYVLPAKSGTAANGWITIRSDKLGQLPGIGTRVTSAHANLMANIQSPNTQPAIKTAASTSGWRLAGLEVSVASSVTAVNYGLIWLGEQGSPQTTLASVPSDLVLDRMYIHGQTTSSVQRCVSLNSARTEISDSYIVECHAKGFDTQAIYGGNGPGPYKIVNNTLAGAGENMMFGGGDPSIPNLVPSDIEVRRNYFFTPPNWKGVWTKKNLLEFKNAARVLVEANIFDGSWTDAQTGWAVLIKSVNQNGGCRWCRTTDITFRRNLIRNAGAGLNMAGNPEAAPVDTGARRILVSENVIEGLNTGAFTGDRRGFQLMAGLSDVTLERNVLAGSSGLQAAVYLDKYRPTVRATLRENVWAYGQLGILADGGNGTIALNVAMPGMAWSNMTFVGTSNGTYPTGTIFVATENAAALSSQIRSIVASATAGLAIP